MFGGNKPVPWPSLAKRLNFGFPIRENEKRNTAAYL
jgi:hypothetical protein